MWKEWFASESGLVKSAYGDFAAMLRQSAKMLDAGVAHLFEGVAPAEDLESMDDRVDEGERMIRRTVLQHLSVSPKQDLVASLLLLSMVQDAERLGDFARGLSEIGALARGPVEGEFADELRAVAERIRGSFDDCESAFVAGEVERGERVIRNHVAIRDQLKAFVRRLAESDLSPDMAIVYAGVAGILRRISAHLANIASGVVQPFDRIRHGDEHV